MTYKFYPQVYIQEKRKLVLAYNASIPEDKAKGSPVCGQSGIHSKFKASLGYITSSSLKKGEQILQ